MMIEINLLPGARKPKKSKGPAMDFGAAFSGAAAQIKDPFLIVAIAGLVLGGALTALQYVMLNNHTAAVAERQATANADTARYTKYMAERASAIAARDAIIRQFTLIEKVDGERFTWSHILAELSALLPQYTWLTRVAQTSAVSSVVVPPPPPPDTTKKKKPEAARSADVVARGALANFNQVKFRLIGQTVDIQAVTSYLRALEASPFLEEVTFVGSDVKGQAQGQEVHEFTIDVSFQKPAPTAIRTVPLNVAVR
jgi:Tfp pilus assembly protein PilN